MILQTLTTLGLFWLECLTLFSLGTSYGGFFAFKCQQSVLVFFSNYRMLLRCSCSGYPASNEQRGTLKKYLLSLLFGRWFCNLTLLTCARFATCKKALLHQLCTFLPLNNVYRKQQWRCARIKLENFQLAWLVMFSAAPFSPAKIRF